jgi:uncharacterized protein YjbI with pentapeptide repeats
MKPMTDAKLHRLLDDYSEALAHGEEAMLELHDIDLRPCALAGRDLRRIRFVEVEISGCDLQGALLGGARLERVRAVDANLTQSSLVLTHLADVDLRGAHLDDADLGAAELVRVDLRGASLAQAVMVKAEMIDCIVDGASMSKVNAKRLTVTRGSMRDVDVTGATFPEAIFSEVDLAGTDVSVADMGSAVLLDCR